MGKRVLLELTSLGSSLGDASRILKQNPTQLFLSVKYLTIDLSTWRPTLTSLCVHPGAALLRSQPAGPIPAPRLRSLVFGVRHLGYMDYETIKGPDIINIVSKGENNLSTCKEVTVGSPLLCEVRAATLMWVIPLRAQDFPLARQCLVMTGSQQKQAVCPNTGTQMSKPGHRDGCR